MSASCTMEIMRPEPSSLTVISSAFLVSPLRGLSAEAAGQRADDAAGDLALAAADIAAGQAAQRGAAQGQQLIVAAFHFHVLHRNHGAQLHGLRLAHLALGVDGGGVGGGAAGENARAQQGGHGKADQFGVHIRESHIVQRADRLLLAQLALGRA